MAAVKNAFFLLTLAVCSSEVTSWIVDMAEVDKSLGEEQIVQKPGSDELNRTDVAGENDSDVMYTSNYAENFRYGSYGNKEVDSVIKNGGMYLEGLSGALAAYRAILDSCARSSTETGVHKPKEELTTCETAEQKKHDVQKLSQMALATTDKLRDDAFENINQDDGNEADLIRLAWTLDRLATLTGHALGAAEAAPRGHKQLSLRDNSPTTTTEDKTDVATEDTREQNLEILEQVENGRPVPQLPPTPLTAVKLTDVRVTDVRVTDVRSVQKRDTGDVMRYYVKYKVWNGSNPIDAQRTEDGGDLDVQNSLRVIPIRKRSVADKKSANMRSALQKMRQLKCKLKERATKSSSKLVKSIKVYRRKIFKNTG